MVRIVLTDKKLKEVDKLYDKLSRLNGKKWIESQMTINPFKKIKLKKESVFLIGVLNGIYWALNNERDAKSFEINNDFWSGEKYDWWK